MRKHVVLCLAMVALFVTFGCSRQQADVAVVPSADTVSAASAVSYYADSSYDLAALQKALSSYPYPVSISIATVNEDGSPNLAVCIPGITDDGKYLVFGLSDNRTKENFEERGLGVVLFYEYTPAAEKAERNKGCKVVVKYVGDEENDRLNKEAGNENASIYMEIVDILPIG